MDWARKTRAEIERELTARLNARKAEYETLKATQHDSIGLWRATGTGNPDGILAGRRVNDGARALAAALDRYQKALRLFNDFIIDGKLPED